MENQLVEWFQWNSVANELFIGIFQRNAPVSQRSVEIFSHIINAHEIWINRICAVDNPIILPWNVERIERFSERNEVIHAITRTLLASESYGQDLDWSFQYKDYNGVWVTSTLRDVYFQILTQSEFYRGQLAKLLSEEGINPPSTDYFSFRNRLN
jgi:uncharacterized damage-inducible protein DinB